MVDDLLAVEVSHLLAPYGEALGEDRSGYTNHVIRTLLFCDELAATSSGSKEQPSRTTEFLVCGAFHDLGIWTDRTFDYLVPSIDLAADHLEKLDRPDLIPLVTKMIDQHHKQRSAGSPDDPVEIFRRADMIDVSLGLRSFGVARQRVRKIRRAYPNRGFHRRLVQLTLKRTVDHPSSPLPMFKW